MQLGGGNGYCNLEEGMVIATRRREWVLQLGGGNGYCILEKGMAIATWRREWLLQLARGKVTLYNGMIKNKKEF